MLDVFSSGNTLGVLFMYLQDQYLQEEGLNEHFGIAEFAAAVHKSACSEDEQDQCTRIGGQPSNTKQLPSVASMVHLVTIFSKLLKEKKLKIHTKVSHNCFYLMNVLKVQVFSCPSHMQYLPCSCTLFYLYIIFSLY